MKSTQTVIVHCAETIKGGVATYLRELIPMQVHALGAGSVVVVVPASQISELPLPLGAKIECFDDSAGRVVSSFRLAFKVFQVAKKYHDGVVHIHSTFAGAVVRPILGLFSRSTQLVYCAHGWAWDRPFSRPVKWMIQLVERRLAFFTAKIVCISEHEYDSAKKVGLPEDKLVLVRNAVNRLAPIPEVVNGKMWPAGALKVLFAGRLDAQKGVDILFGALNQLEGKAHAIVAGAAVLSTKQIQPETNHASFIGWVSPGQLQWLFLHADVLVVPSRWEGFGLVAVEAMRAGLPVVASAVGGLKEIVLDGVTGYLFEPNTSKQLAIVLGTLDPQELKKIGELAKNHANKLFSLERLHQELFSVYENCK